MTCLSIVTKLKLTFLNSCIALIDLPFIVSKILWTTHSSEIALHETHTQQKQRVNYQCDCRDRLHRYVKCWLDNTVSLADQRHKSEWGRALWLTLELYHPITFIMRVKRKPLVRAPKCIKSNSECNGFAKPCFIFCRTDSCSSFLVPPSVDCTWQCQFWIKNVSKVDKDENYVTLTNRDTFPHKEVHCIPIFSNCLKLEVKTFQDFLTWIWEGLLMLRVLCRHRRRSI